jgi:hypothetical protein
MLTPLYICFVLKNHTGDVFHSNTRVTYVEMYTLPVHIQLGVPKEVPSIDISSFLALRIELNST